jgi:hypothetical protein
MKVKNNIEVVLNILILFFSLGISYLEFASYFPPDASILLEFKKTQNTPYTVNYEIISVYANDEYQIDNLRIKFDDKAEIAKFAYRNQNFFDINPKESQLGEYKYKYDVSQNWLRKIENDDRFKFKFLPDAKMVFFFKFEENIPSQLDCDVDVYLNDKISKEINCYIKEVNYLSYFRGLAWYAFAGLLWFIAFIVLRILFFLLSNKSEKTDIPPDW